MRNLASGDIQPWGEDHSIAPMLNTGVRGVRTIVEEHDPQGFTVNNVRARGSVLTFPNQLLLWSPREQHEITIESLVAVELAEPPIEMLIIGAGDRISSPLDPALRNYFRDLGIVVELMNTVNACATFNILNAEDRSVAGAFLCPPVAEGLLD